MRHAVLGLIALATVGCGSAETLPSLTPVPVAPTAMPTEPCNVGVLADAIASADPVEGYRFVEEVAYPQPPRVVGGEREWVATRTEGAYLAPARQRAKVVLTDDPLGPATGFLEEVRIDRKGWRLVPAREGSDAEWQESTFPDDWFHRLEAVASATDGQSLAPDAGIDVAALPGDGGCVMATVLADGDGDGNGNGATLAVRLDPVERRVIAFLLDSDESRWRLEFRYDVPSADEFTPPSGFSGGS